MCLLQVSFGPRKVEEDDLESPVDGSTRVVSTLLLLGTYERPMELECAIREICGPFRARHRPGIQPPVRILMGQDLGKCNVFGCERGMKFEL